MNGTHRPYTNGYLPHLAVILAAAALAMAWQFVFPAVYQSADDDAAALFKYVPQFMESYRHGIMYPRWMPDDFNGYGSPAFVFYSPLLYILSALLSLAGLDLVFIKSLLELLRLFTGGAFVYLLIRDSHGKRAALAAALLYTLLPGRIIDLYYANSPAGRFGQAFMPMCLFFTRKLVTEPFRGVNLAAASASYAALVLSHLASAFLFTPFLLAYGVLGTKASTYRSASYRTILGMGMGIMLSCIYFMPMLLEGNEVRLYLTGRFSYWENFLLALPRAALPPDKEGLIVLLRNAVVVEFGVLAVVLFVRRSNPVRRMDRESWFRLASSCICIFMMSSPSMFLWKVVPGLATVGFPARFEPINILFLSMFAGVFVPDFFTPGKRYIATTAMLSALLVFILLYDARMVAGSITFSAQEAEKAASDILYPEYLPKSVETDALPGLEGGGPLLSSSGPSKQEIRKWTPAFREFTVDSPQGARLRVKTFYFPGWKAFVDGKEAGIYPEKGTGAILLNVPPGRHDVALRFTNTWPRIAGAALSAVSLGALVLLVLFNGRSRKNRNQ